LKLLRRIKIPFEAILVLVVLGLYSYVIFSPENSLMNWYTTDDAFYYFKTAQNVSEGYGFTFDKINPTNGFHPLWMAICIPVFALARYDLVLPLRLIVLVQGLLAAGTAIMIYRLLSKLFYREVGIVMSLFWVLVLRIFNVTAKLGMESGISAFCIMLLVYLVARLEINRKAGEVRPRDLIFLGTAAILTVFSRLDNIFLVLLVGVWVVFRSTHVRYFLICDILLIVASVLASYVLRLKVGHGYYQYLPSIYWMLGVSLVVRLIANYVLGLYRHPRYYSPLKLAIRVAAAVTGATALISIIILGLSYLNVFSGFPRMILPIDWGLSLASILAVRFIGRLITRNQDLADPEINQDVGIRANWKNWLVSAASYYGPVGGALVIYMAWNVLVFGTSTPVSGQIKQWWGTLPNTVYGHRVDTLQNFMGLLPDDDNGPWSMGISVYVDRARWLTSVLKLDKETALPTVQTLTGLGFLALALVVFWFNRQLFKKSLVQIAIIPLVAGCLLHIVYYKDTGYVNTRNWYWIMEMICTTLAFGVFLGFVDLSLRRIGVKPVFLYCAAILMIYPMAFTFMKSLTHNFPWNVPAEEAREYQGGMLALEKATEPGALIGSTGGGAVAYFIQGRTIVNLDGLMNSNTYFEMMQKGTASQLLDAIGLDYVFGTKYVITKSDPYFSVFKDRLKYLGDVGGSSLYKYIVPAYLYDQ
jgi:hypothetical protein